MSAVSLKEMKTQLMADPEFRREYEALEDEFSLAATLIEARKRAGMTQKQVAEAMGVSQPAVAKIEAGKLVSLRTLKRYAEATKSRLEIRLPPA